MFPSHDPISWSDLGQNISSAVSSVVDRKTRDIASRSAQLSLENQELQNDFLRSQINQLNAAGTPPGISANPSSSVPGVKDLPLERVVGRPGSPNQEAGDISEVGLTRTRHGYAPVMSQDTKNRLEEDFFGTIGWNLRNRLLPMFGVNKADLPEVSDREWYFDPVLGEYRPVKYYR